MRGDEDTWGTVAGQVNAGHEGARHSQTRVGRGVNPSPARAVRPETGGTRHLARPAIYLAHPMARVEGRNLLATPWAAAEAWARGPRRIGRRARAPWRGPKRIRPQWLGESRGLAAPVGRHARVDVSRPPGIKRASLRPRWGSEGAGAAHSSIARCADGAIRS